MRDALLGVGKAVGIAFSAQQAIAFVKQIVSVRSEIQALEVSFRTLLGSQQASAELMHQMKEFAAATPLQLGDLAKGAQTMLQIRTIGSTACAFPSPAGSQPDQA